MDIVPTITQPIEKLTSKELSLDESGATRKVAYDKIVEKLNAKTITLDKFGGEHESDDNVTQLKAAELISKLRGDLKETVVDARVYNNTINTVSAEEMEAFGKMVREMKDEMHSLIKSGRQTGEVIDAEFTRG